MSPNVTLQESGAAAAGASANDDVQRASLDIATVITPKIADPWTVDKVLATVPGGKPVEGSSSPVPYFHILERLKTTKREGWRRFGIDR